MYAYSCCQSSLSRGAMLAILLMNVFAPLIDHVVIQQNINRRKKALLSQTIKS